MRATSSTIAEYADACRTQEVAAKAEARLERLEDLHAMMAREAVLFASHPALEADFWNMCWRVGLRVE